MGRYNLASDSVILTSAFGVILVALTCSVIHGWTWMEVLLHLGLVIATPIVMVLILGGVGLALGMVLIKTSSSKHHHAILQLSCALAILGFWIGLMMDLFIIIIPLPVFKSPPS